MTAHLTEAQYRKLKPIEVYLPEFGDKKPPRKYHIPESLIVNACIRWLWQHGCFVWRNNSGALKPEGSTRPIRYGKPGSPDIVGMTPSGRWLGIECKSGKNKLTDLQETFRDQVTEHNGLYILAYGTEDLELHKGEILA